MHDSRNGVQSCLEEAKRGMIANIHSIFDTGEKFTLPVASEKKCSWQACSKKSFALLALASTSCALSFVCLWQSFSSRMVWLSGDSEPEVYPDEQGVPR